MKAQLNTLIISSLCLASLSVAAHAFDSASAPMPSGSQFETPPASSGASTTANGGITVYNGGGTTSYSNGTTYYSGVAQPAEREHTKYKFKVKYPRHDTYFVRTHFSEPSYTQPTWVEMMRGYAIPYNVVVGGFDPAERVNLYVCRGNYGGGIHPGKLIDGMCNISWGGMEVRLDRYQVLVSSYQLSWMPGNDGYVPPNAIPGGGENGHALYICQARFRGGMHTGKLTEQTCNIGWGGREILIPNYNVLVG